MSQAQNSHVTPIEAGDHAQHQALPVILHLTPTLATTRKAYHGSSTQDYTMSNDIVPQLPPESSSPRTLSPAILTYLTSIASNKRPLPYDQAQELQSYSSRTHHGATAQAPSQVPPHLPTGKPESTPPLDLKQFLKYITSEEGNAMSKLPEQDLSYPISNYFINSSHNTYLTGNQLYSDASTDAYKNVRTREWQ
ncbi:MAG: hypothetical protein Q9179_006151 [Wetmoreana sp. 5 TL-2023]